MVMEDRIEKDEQERGDRKGWEQRKELENIEMGKNVKL